MVEFGILQYFGTLHYYTFNREIVKCTCRFSVVNQIPPTLPYSLPYTGTYTEHKHCRELKNHEDE
uniref:Uncharacterized protein n=1 Tax=Anguilla anguilla TaxID=7936 RepID=A0A0E9RPJ9_ANGAN